MISFSTLVSRLRGAGLLLDASPGEEPRVSSVTCDSRTVTAGSCFVAIRGTQVDGHRYIGDAIARGAPVIISEADPPDRVAWIQVSDTRKALAHCAAAYYKDPAEKLSCVGITGTNGKSTTAWLLHHALRRMGQKSGMLGTVTYDTGELVIDSTLTTPDAANLHQMLHAMVGEGCHWCVMEVSSHALDQHRVHTIPYSGAIFTNLQHDHLDYHKTVAAYARAKKMLFDGLSSTAIAVYNADEDVGPYMVQDTAASAISYGLDQSSDVRFEVISDTLHGVRVCLDGHDLQSRLSGHYNGWNLAAAYTQAVAAGFEGAQVCQALADVPPVPGRFEPIRFDDGVLAIVDYSHTPDSLRFALNTARQYARESALWCVFGCGGDRDITKRPVMGNLAERLADQVVVTTDNLRSETYPGISADIENGMKDPSNARWIEDRFEAITHVSEKVRPGDVVLVAGMGHELSYNAGNPSASRTDRELLIEAFRPRTAIES